MILSTKYYKIINIVNENKSIMPTALITGITGQDGSYLAEFLLKKVMKYMG